MPLRLEPDDLLFREDLPRRFPLLALLRRPLLRLLLRLEAPVSCPWHCSSTWSTNCFSDFRLTEMSSSLPPGLGRAGPLLLVPLFLLLLLRPRLPLLPRVDFLPLDRELARAIEVLDAPPDFPLLTAAALRPLDLERLPRLEVVLRRELA